MRSKVEKAREKQTGLLKTIEVYLGISTVTCPSCGELLFYEEFDKENPLTCPSCEESFAGPDAIYDFKN